jgi:AcrR family transcriptional regulator
MEKISARAGLSKAALYLYFKSKDEILVKIMEEGLDRQIRLAREVSKRSVGVEEKLRIILLGQLKHAEVEFNILRSLFVRTAVRLMTAKKRDEFRWLKPKLEEYGRVLAVIIQEGMERKVLRRGDPLELAYAFMSVARGTLLQKLIMGSQRSVEDESAMVLSLFLHGARRDQR